MRIHINSFGGVQPNTDARLLPNGGAQVAHNCLLEDGSLQAMPQWSVVGDGPISVGKPSAGNQYTAYPGYCGISFYGPPFGQATIYLNASGQLQPSVASYATGTVSVVPANLSIKAVNRVYGVTSVVTMGGVDYESDLTVLNGSNPKQVMFEGDIATISMSGTGSVLRLYRSTSDVTTGGGTSGVVTANWQLVTSLVGTTATYVDAGAATLDAFDTYLYRGPTQQPFLAYRMGLLESGYVWLVSEDGQIALSDRFAWGYWPVENTYSLGNAPSLTGIVVTGTACLGDTLYIGTQIGVFACEAHVTEAGTVVLSVIAVPEAPPCLPNTMVVSPGGAMYTCVQGVVGLEGPRATLLSRTLARAVFGYDPDGTALAFSAIGNAVYHNGRYYGVSGGLPPPLSLAGHLINGYENTVVNYQYLVGGGTAPRTVTVFSGTFPAGLSINTAGLVTGRRTVAGLYSFRLKVIDAVGAIVYLDDTSQTISTDIVNWVTAQTGATQSPNSSAVSGDVVLVLNNAGQLSVSPDRGVTWTNQSISGLGLIAPYYLTYFAGDWYVFEGTSRQGGMKTVGTALPITFVPFANGPSGPGGDGVSGVFVLGSNLYAGAYGSLANYTLVKLLSVGSAWLSIDTGVAVGASFASITCGTFTGSSYLFGTSDGKILRSVDLLYFTVQLTGATSIYSIASLDEIIVATNSSAVYYRSTDDGVTFGSPGTPALGSVVATPSMFIAGYSHTINTSTDGITWTVRWTDAFSGAIAALPASSPTLAVFPIQSGQAYVGSAS